MMLDRKQLRPAALALAVGGIGFVSGCGGATPARPQPLPPATPAELAWINNASNLVRQLTDGVVVTAYGGSDIATARVALDDESDLLTMLMASVAFESCEESVRNVGVPDTRVISVATTLSTACGFLRQASRLFTQATEHSDPQALLKAARITRKASPLLASAQTTLDALRAELEPKPTP